MMEGLFITTLTDPLPSFKAARHRSRYSAAGDSYSCIHDPTHCSRDKHLARPDINKRKGRTYLLPIPSLLTMK